MSQKQVPLCVISGEKKLNQQNNMIVLIGIVCFFYAAYCCYSAVEYYKLFATGVHTTATISEIEKITHYDEDNNEVIYYYLHLDLPNYHGWKLGKKYEKSIDPTKYVIGDSVEIIHNKDKPTELVVKKELTYMENPINCLLIGLFLYLVSYISCYVIE